MNEQKDVYYVGFQDSDGLRKSILEAAKDVVNTARAHSRLRDIQDEKLRLRTELAVAVKDAKESLAKLQGVLPYKDVANPPAEQPKRKIISDHKLDKIEAALQEIELRMRSL